MSVNPTEMGWNFLPYPENLWEKKKSGGYSKPQNSGNDLNDLLNLSATLLEHDSSVKAHRLLACTAELPNKNVRETLQT